MDAGLAKVPFILCDGMLKKKQMGHRIMRVKVWIGIWVKSKSKVSVGLVGITLPSTPSKIKGDDDMGRDEEYLRMSVFGKV